RMHEFLGLSCYSRVCAECNYDGRGNSVLYFSEGTMILCENCYDFCSDAKKLDLQCSFCCYNGYKCNKCYICYSNNNLIKLDHWEEDWLVEYTICETCALGKGYEGKRVLKATHSYLSIIKN